MNSRYTAYIKYDINILIQSHTLEYIKVLISYDVVNDTVSFTTSSQSDPDQEVPQIGYHDMSDLPDQYGQI